MPKETSVSFNEAVQRTLNLVTQKPHSEWVKHLPRTWKNLVR